MLTGVEVLDLSNEKASYCTKILALLGARVIKVEQPGGDPARERGPFLKNAPYPDQSLSFCFNNTNKWGVTLNLSAPEGRRLFAKLIRRADILVETFTPAERQDFACGYEELSTLQPRLIHVSVTGFGQTGPRSNYQSCDLIAAAFGGAMYVSGTPSGPPLKPGGEQSYAAGSLFAVLAILLALRKRKKSGRGEYLDLSLQEAVTATLEHVLVRYFHNETVAVRRGNRHWDDAFCILPCRDGFIQMTVFQQWETLVGWMASEGMAGDLEEEKWQDETFRRAHVEHIVSILAEWTRSHGASELFQSGQLMGFPWAPVQSPAQVLASVQLKERGYFTSPLEGDTEEALHYPGLPFKFSDLPLPALQKAPSAGKDNARIYGDELGLSPAEMERLSTLGII